jgi:predicted small secreted protein
MTTIKRNLLLALLLSSSFQATACDVNAMLGGFGPEDLCGDDDECEPSVPPPPKLPLRGR